MSFSVCVFAVTNTDDLDNKFRLENLIDDTIIADAQAVGALAAFEFPNAGWKWIGSQGLNHSEYPRYCLTVKALDLTKCGFLPFNPISIHLF